MSLINSVRLININYNNDNFRINNEIYYFDGKNALLNLDNGGGKTVIVQLIMAPFLQKNRRDLGNRKFSSHFLTPNPSFILVEWLLDGNETTRVLTGMMVRKNQHLSENNNNELEIINFVSEYNKEVQCDIINFPVIEKKDNQLILKSFAECVTLFDRFKKNKSLKFSYYDMNTPYQSKSYFDKIKEYGINYKEWNEIIREVNKEEAGLSKIFEECKDERRLIEKWFLTKIQAKLTKDKKIPDELQNTVEEFLYNRHRLDATILQKDAIVKFQTDSQQILDASTKCLNAKAKEVESRNLLYTALSTLKELIQTTKDQYGYLQAEAKKNINIATHMELEEASLAFYEQQAVFESNQKHLKETTINLDKIIDLLNAQEEIKRLYDCSVLQQQIDSYEAKRASLKAEDEIAKNKFKEFDTELAELGGELKTYFKLHLLDYQKNLDNLGDRIKYIEKTKNENQKNVNSCRHDLELLAGQIGKLEASIKNYELIEDEYVATYKVLFTDSEYATPHNYPLTVFEAHANNLNVTKQNIGEKLNNLRVEKASVSQKIKQNEQQKSDQNHLLKDAEVQLTKANFKFEQYENEIESRKTILSYLDLGEDVLFETTQILARHDTKISELETLKTQLLDRQRKLQRSLEYYKHGFLNLSDEFKNLCEKLELPLVYGFEWLKQQDISFEEKERLLQRFPLLPYALIFGKDEFNKLNVADPVLVFSPIPIIIRESLTDSTLKSDSTEILFYTHYETQIFEAKHLSERINEIQKDIQAIKNQINTRNKEINNFNSRKIIIEQQTLEIKAYNKVCEERAKLSQTIQNHKDLLISLERTRQDLQDNEQKYIQQIEASVLDLQAIAEQEKTFKKLLTSYTGYLKAKKDYQQCIEGQVLFKEKISTIQKENEEFEQELKIQLASQSELKLLIKNLKADKLEMYSAYQERTSLNPDFEVNSVEARYQTLLAAQNKHLNVNLNRIENELKDVNKNLVLLKRQLEMAAIEAGFSDKEWKKRIVTNAEVEASENQIKLLQKRQHDQLVLKDELTKQVGIDEGKLNQLRSNLSRWNTSDPIPREKIRDLNFSVEIKKYYSIVKKITDELSQKSRLQQELSNIAVFYDDYKQVENLNVDCELPNFFTLANVEPKEIRSFLKARESDLQQSKVEQDRENLNLKNTISEIYRNSAYSPIKNIMPNLQPIADYPEKIAKELPIKLQVLAEMLQIMEKDLTKIEEEKQIIINLILDYIDNVQREFKTIDSNSTIKIREQSKKILKIELPDWEENNNLFKTKIRDYIEGLISQSLKALKKGENIHEQVGLALTTRELFDRIIGIPNVKISLLKVEAQRELLIPWNRVVTNSGGEGFLSAFIILSSLLSYMRNDEHNTFSSAAKAGKVLIMDNPFGKTSAEHLLRPLISIAKKNNLQLICLTALRDPAIYDRFDNIYILKLSEPNSQGVSYLKSSLQKGGASNLTQARFQVLNKEETLLEDIFSTEQEL
ncbi:MAG: hypothetical protein IJU76_14915 [Desulfovibrionaceae bacterium]|nr:hypothetical protein [Desulfovibrionaceae bacterium]